MNFFWIILGTIGAACILLILNHDSGMVFGIENDRFASLVWYGVWASVIAVAILPGSGSLRNIARSAALWLAIFLVIMTGYIYRFEMQDLGARLSGGLIPGSPVTMASEGGGERTLLIRSNSGHFEARGEVNGAPVRFLVDTGASVIVLTNQDAEAAGIDTRSLSYTMPVTTANGRTTAARVTLNDVSIGTITRPRMPALIARPGSLDQSLLGMNFLSTLTSFEFRGDRLILTN